MSRWASLGPLALEKVDLGLKSVAKPWFLSWLFLLKKGTVIDFPVLN